MIRTDLATEACSRIKEAELPGMEKEEYEKNGVKNPYYLRRGVLQNRKTQRQLFYPVF